MPQESTLLLPLPSVRDKLADWSDGRKGGRAEIPASLRWAGLLPSAGTFSRETAVSFGSPPRFLFFIFPRLRAAFQAASNFFFEQPASNGACHVSHT